MADNEEKLTRLAKNGHQSAVESLYLHYFEPIYRFCYWQTNRSADAEDLTQDIFVEMAKSIRNFRGKSSFKNWLYVIAKRKINDWVREKYHYPKSELLDIIGNTEEWVDEHNESLKRKTVQQLLDTLNTQERKVISLRYLKNYSVKETAAKLRISESNVKILCHRSLKKLKHVKKGKSL